MRMQTYYAQITSTDADINVSCGFQPTKVHIINETSGDQLLWTASMANGEGLKTVAAGTSSFLGSLGISLYPGTSAGDGEGFTIGTDTDINTTGSEVLHVYAEGNAA